MVVVRGTRDVSYMVKVYRKCLEGVCVCFYVVKCDICVLATWLLLEGEREGNEGGWGKGDVDIVNFKWIMSKS